MHAERPRERRSRTIRLHERIDPKRTDARYSDGVLELRLAKEVNTIPVELH
ncbi:hypothetical protein ACFQJD_09345 [Haloplanus sp. GCM10025708]|uniref:hypothetical protein n=1 Tax=Haloferacaceae TaxID=1644056 RepID=UPI0036211E80